MFFLSCQHSRFAPKLACLWVLSPFSMFCSGAWSCWGVGGRKGTRPDVLSLGLNLASTACPSCRQEQVTRLPFAEYHLCAWCFRTTLCPATDGQTESRDILGTHGSQAVELGFKDCVCLWIQGFLMVFFRVRGSAGGGGWGLEAVQSGWLWAPNPPSENNLLSSVC